MTSEEERKSAAFGGTETYNTLFSRYLYMYMYMYTIFVQQKCIHTCIYSICDTVMYVNPRVIAQEREEMTGRGEMT